MRLIDADALSAKMYHDAFETDSDMQKWDSGCWIRYKMFENAMDSAPTIEPERKKGKWIKDGHHIGCNKCGTFLCNTDIEGDAIPMNFCPNCGARMEEENGTD